MSISICVCLLSLLPIVAGFAQPQYIRDQVSRAVTAINAGQYDSAIRILDPIVHRYPAYHHARYELALSLSMQQRFHEAINHCTMLCDSTNDSRNLSDKYFQLLGNLYALVEDSSKAEQTLLKGLSYFPRSGRLHVELGILYGRRQKLELALIHFDTAICIDPNYRPSYYWRTQYSKLAGDRISTVLCGEVYLSTHYQYHDDTDKRIRWTSSLWYDSWREIVEDYDDSQQIRLFAQTLQDTISDKKPYLQSLSDALSAAIASLTFNRDFELPVASIDTLLRIFIHKWYASRNHEHFPNVIFERYKKLTDAGLLSAYVHTLARYAKPMQYEEYRKTHAHLLKRLYSWLRRNPIKVRCEKFPLVSNR